MKIFFILFILITSNCIFAQNFTISEFEKCDDNYKSQKLIQDIHSQEEDVTILKLNNYNYLAFGDDIYKYNVVESENLILRKEKLSSKGTSHYRQLLDTLKTINPSLLNITKNEKGERIVVEDGVTFQIELLKGNCQVNYISDNPHIYIKNRYPNFELRKKFLTVFEDMQSLFYDKEYEKLKRDDTIFLVYDKLDEIRNVKIDKISNNGIVTYSFLFSDGKSLGLKTLDKEIRSVKKKSIKDVVKIDLSILNNYRFKAMFEILSTKRAIYIIHDEPGDKKSKIKVTRAYLDYTP